VVLKGPVDVKSISPPAHKKKPPWSSYQASEQAFPGHVNSGGLVGVTLELARYLRPRVVPHDVV
jgi:hypothetical protein